MTESSLPPMPVPTAEEQVRFLTTAVNHSETAVLVTEAGLIDPPGPRIVYANPAFAAMTGYELSEVVGRSPRFLQGPRTDRAELDRLRSALARREPVRVELVNYTRSGVEFRVEMDVVPLRDAAGKTTHFLALQRDVTGSRRSEQMLARAQRAAEQSNRARSETLAMASQEIRTPVNALLGFVDLLFDSRLDADQRDHLETIRTCGEDLLRLSNELLDLARIEAGRLEIASVPFEPLQVVRSVLDGFEGEIARKGVEVVLRADPAVPARAVGDPSRVRQILHAAAGALLRTVDRGRIEVAVTRTEEPDAGERSRRFRLRYDLRETEAAGTPLGAAEGEGVIDRVRPVGSLDLAVARRVAQLMGGGIESRIEPGRGSSFSLSALVGEAAEAGSAPAAAPPERARILVVEDNPVNQKLLLALLRRLGHGADLAAHGEEALERLRAASYDIVFMDVQMPVMDGFECTRQIRGGAAGPAHAAIPIVAVTAGAMRGDREKCLEAGMNDYLSKPISAQSLQAVLDKAKAPAT